MRSLWLRTWPSATEYCFREEQGDAIIQTTTYRSNHLARSVIWFSPYEHTAIHPSITAPFPRVSNTAIGSLGRLPLELLHDVLLCLDIYSLFKFRQVSLRSRQLVDFIREYQIVVSHGLNLLCALMRTKLSTHTLLLDIYDVLCTKECTICGSFGGFIFLFTQTRCCYQCLHTVFEFEVESLDAAKEQFHLTKAALKQLKSFRNLPETYSIRESTYTPRVRVVSAFQAYLLGGQPDEEIQVEPAPKRNRELNSMGSCALPYYDRRTGEVEHGMSCAGCQIAYEKRVIGLWGEDWIFTFRDKIYAKDDFLEHFRLCRQAQLLWDSSLFARSLV
ncbi:hypothetical protein F5Y10DRAFT_238596 [Nemania abortiva]|nr:hypothetical protein F5Y10DRAFT_238596 [Nemania abortiva]